MSDQCPKCGAALSAAVRCPATGIMRAPPFFACGTIYHKDKAFRQSKACRINELEGENAKLKAELAETVRLHKIGLDLIASAMRGPETCREYDADVPMPSWERKAAMVIERLLAELASALGLRDAEHQAVNMFIHEQRKLQAELARKQAALVVIANSDDNDLGTFAAMAVAVANAASKEKP